MAFPEDSIKQAWERACGQCECRRRIDRYFYTPCGKLLVWENKGKVSVGGWEAHYVSASCGDVLSNCEILCFDCHEATMRIEGIV